MSNSNKRRRTRERIKREKENSTENHAKKRRGKLVSLDPFSLLVVLEMSRKFRCHLGAATHHANAPLARKAHIRARKYFPNTTRTILLARFLQTASSIQTQMRVLDLSQGRKRGLKNVKAGLENFNLIPLRAQTHATRTIKTNSLLLTFSRPSTFVFKTRKMCWKSSPTIKAMMR